MEPYLKTAGVLMMALALIHLFFPRYFRWKEELAQLSIANRQIMYVHTSFIAFVVFLMGMLCFSSASDLAKTLLGRKIALGLAIFWTARLPVQFFCYSSVLWKGKVFETTIHVLFTMLWIYFSSVFTLTYLMV